MVYKVLQKDRLIPFFAINFAYVLLLSAFVFLFEWDKLSFFGALSVCYLYAFLFYFSLVWIFMKKKGAWALLTFKYVLLFLILMLWPRFFDSSSLLLALSALLVLIFSYVFFQILN